MTIGENIRRIRKERGLTLRQLGDMLGTTEAYIRAYESGRRNPKPGSLERIAKALDVSPEALSDSEIDDIKAMHRLFQVFRKYDGELFEYQDSNGNMKIGISFNKLALMEEWYERYEEYQKQIKVCDEIKDVKTRAKSLLEIENEFQSWMDNLL